MNKTYIYINPFHMRPMGSYLKETKANQARRDARIVKMVKTKMVKTRNLSSILSRPIRQITTYRDPLRGTLYRERKQRKAQESLGTQKKETAKPTASVNDHSLTEVLSSSDEDVSENLEDFCSGLHSAQDKHCKKDSIKYFENLAYKRPKPGRKDRKHNIFNYTKPYDCCLAIFNLFSRDWLLKTSWGGTLIAWDSKNRVTHEVKFGNFWLNAPFDLNEDILKDSQKNSQKKFKIELTRVPRAMSDQNSVSTDFNSIAVEKNLDLSFKQTEFEDVCRKRFPESTLKLTFEKTRDRVYIKIERPYGKEPVPAFEYKYDRVEKKETTTYSPIVTKVLLDDLTQRLGYPIDQSTMDRFQPKKNNKTNNHNSNK